MATAPQNMLGQLNHGLNELRNLGLEMDGRKLYVIEERENHRCITHNTYLGLNACVSILSLVLDAISQRLIGNFYEHLVQSRRQEDEEVGLYSRKT